MLEQISNQVSFAAQYIASKIGKTGLSPTVDIYKLTGINTITVISSGANAYTIGGGLYGYTLAASSVDVEGLYFAIFKTTDSSVDIQHIPSLWAIQKAGIENLDAPTSSRSTLSSSQVWSYPDKYVSGVTGNVTGSVGSVASPVTVGTNNDKTGYAFTAGFVATVGTVTGSVGSVANPVTVGTNNDKTGYSLSATASGLIVDGVWDELRTGHTTPGTFGYYLDSQIGSLQGTVNLLLTATQGLIAWQPVQLTTPTGDVTLYSGYDYVLALGTQLDWSSNAWTNLASATIYLVDRQENIVKQGSVVTSGQGVSQTVRVELTQAEVATLGLGEHKLRLKAVLGAYDYILVDLTMKVH